MVFFQTLPSHPSSKRLQSRREAKPTFPPFIKSQFCLMCVCYWSQLTLKRSNTVENSCKKTANIKKYRKRKNLLTSRPIINQESISCLFSLTWTGIFSATSWKWHLSKLHNCLLCLSSLRRSRDVTTDIYIFNILNSVFYLFVMFIYHLIYLSYTFIYLLFIYLLFTSVRFCILRTPVKFLALK